MVSRWTYVVAILEVPRNLWNETAKRMGSASYRFSFTASSVGRLETGPT